MGRFAYAAMTITLAQWGDKRSISQPGDLIDRSKGCSNGALRTRVEMALKLRPDAEKVAAKGVIEDGPARTTPRLSECRSRSAATLSYENLAGQRQPARLTAFQ